MDISSFIAGATGAFGIKILDILYQEMIRKKNNHQSAKQFVDAHLDPFLKSADEVEGKLHSLIKNNFQSINGIPFKDRNQNNDYISLFYLLAKFWANIEILRVEGLAVAISEDKRGQQLQSFLECLHLKEMRLVDRITQRAVGEILIKEVNGKLGVIPFIEFYELIENKNEILNKWTEEISIVLHKSSHKHNTQRLILYSIVINAMLQTLDPDNTIVKNRPTHTKRLSDKSNKVLEGKVLMYYLKFIRDTENYSKKGMTRRQLNAFYKKNKKQGK